MLLRRIILGGLLGMMLSTSLSAKGILRENEILVSDLKGMRAELADAPKWVFEDPKVPYEEMGVAYIPIDNKYLGIEQATLNAKMSMIVIFHEVFTRYRKRFAEQFHESDETVTKVGYSFYNYLVTKIQVADTYTNMKAGVAVVKIKLEGCQIEQIKRYLKASVENLNDNEVGYIAKIVLKELGNVCVLR
ncbi:hypothetical protein [Helicobacter cetorum]|uniref:Uncharacterized protein n=1 Tax=Helicobacter cetorum (strain ATCC BAA-540 / CCUG 52418 / MIT 99-5656) TaxID=1163745 RepID=I0ETM7_HELCM|nr:hypothetical protein [Helicobacter cetorum]AFI06296.1 hypothetical protein HCD_06470 [Helicobacter cetorum MIT 99-5656]